MLRIDIPTTESTKTTATVFNEFDIPKPPNGTDTEINNDLILLFDDEEEAVAYLEAIEDYGTELDSDAPEKQILNEIVSAISNDEFVQAYLKQ
ncbi:hypothetical protein FPZ43_02635 [Mucilaginibacter pallidiroseus]|uniref:Uncharacterized protein n=1 Tax=Mucilaginibacter pallidiroseus TaxID=2599295 RepID=A0A563UJ71_9SPHI|nr:hypothetical protein [Mucilaginibacter pallidiroseus]TWR31391.1 hypothetical protein FPZ43_02635 [Mucilaginibacter pallidiroseus]